jgi:CIC family chloride channel protein
VVRTVVYGLAVGLAVVGFATGTRWVYGLGLERLSEGPGRAFVWGSLACVLGTGAVTGWLLYRFCPEARGSGIPQVKVAFWKDFGYIPWRVAWVKFVAGVLSIGGGASLGREGPSVQLAAAVASNAAGVFGEPKQSRRLAAAAGAAAGLAAAFNTPLAAVTFVLEEIVQDLNSRILGSVLLASVLGAFTAHALVGRQPAFALEPVQPSGWPVYGMVPCVAAAAALVGVLFQKAILAVRDQRQHRALSGIPMWLRPALGGFVTWAVGVPVFFLTGRLGVFSLGYDDLSAGLAQQLPWGQAGVLLAAKFVATVACYGFGGCGGIFSPTLFLGGMCGLFLGGLTGGALALTPEDQVLLGVVGMSACLGAVVRAPITGLLIVFEMTHEFALVPAFMVGALVSQAISRRMSRHNFYDALLVQDGHRLEHLVPPRDLREWQERPVTALMTPRPVVATSLEAEALRKLLRSHPYERFPVMLVGRLSGVLTRQEAETAWKERRPPRLQRATVCGPTTSIREAQRLLPDAPLGMLVVCDGSGRVPVGVLTLHDLLRAQIAWAEGTALPEGLGGF